MTTLRKERIENLLEYVTLSSKKESDVVFFIESVKLIYDMIDKKYADVLAFYYCESKKSIIVTHSEVRQDHFDLTSKLRYYVNDLTELMLIKDYMNFEFEEDLHLPEWAAYEEYYAYDFLSNLAIELNKRNIRANHLILNKSEYPDWHFEYDDEDSEDEE